MSEPGMYTLSEAQLHFAKSLNGKAWTLLEKPVRKDAEKEELILAASASLYHWMQVGTAVHIQRGHWLLSHIYAVFERGELAREHAQRCMSITLSNPEGLQDFDTAYAHEAMARVFGLIGNDKTARMHYEHALKAGEAIADQESREIFMEDFKGGDWHSLA